MYKYYEKVKLCNYSIYFSHFTHAQMSKIQKKYKIMSVSESNYEKFSR